MDVATNQGDQMHEAHFGCLKYILIDALSIDALRCITLKGYFFER